MQVSIAQRITRCNSALKIGYKRLEIGSAFWGFPAFNFSSHVSASVFALADFPASKFHSSMFIFPNVIRGFSPLAFNLSLRVPVIGFVLAAISANPPFRSLCCCERNSC